MGSRRHVRVMQGLLAQRNYPPAKLFDCVAMCPLAAFSACHVAMLDKQSLLHAKGRRLRRGYKG